MIIQLLSIYLWLYSFLVDVGCFFNFLIFDTIIRMIKSRRMRWAGHVAGTGKKRNTYRILVGMPEGKRPLGRPRRR
jgi:hypothetical protein